MDPNKNFLDANNASIGHISDNVRPSKRKQHGVANKHLGIFIEKYYQSRSHLGLKQDSCPISLPFHVIDNDEFVGHFSTSWQKRLHGLKIVTNYCRSSQPYVLHLHSKCST
jgi:hypothetical protein